VRAERELARRAHSRLGDQIEFCLYDRPRNLIWKLGNAAADDIINGRLQVDFAAPPPSPSFRDQFVRGLNVARRQVRRAALSNAGAYHALQRLRGRSLTREDVLRIQAEEFAARPAAPPAKKKIAFVSDVAPEPAGLDAETCIISGGLDWQYKDLRNLYALKGTFGFQYAAIVYDIIPVTFPHLTPSGYSTFLTDYFGELVWLADQTLCISESTRREWMSFCRTLGVDTLPTHVFPLGSDPAAPVQSTEASLPEQLEGKRFALFVSTIEPRKNHRVLYEAWERCVRSRLIDPDRDRLVFVGRRSLGVDDLMREISTNPATKDTILILNHVADDVLHLLYERCAFVLFPSIYEGFGLPVAEALGYGRPCITSDAGSLSEIGEGFVVRINPKDTMRWINTIAHYMNAPDELEDWSRRIVAQYRSVTWNDAAERFFGLLKDIRR
jgi:glycosyltransferase involved in cell wall biosynthesis